MTAPSFSAESGGGIDCVDGKEKKCFVGKVKKTFTFWQFFLYVILCGVFPGCPLCNPGKNEAIKEIGGPFNPTDNLVAVDKGVP